MARYYPPPLHQTIIEPFAGGAGYSTFYGLHRVVLFDADPIIAGLWQYLIRVSENDILNLPELLDVGDCVDNYDVPQEAKWLIGFWLNRGSATPKKSRTAYSARTDKAQLNWGERAKQRIASQLAYIRDWKAHNASYESAEPVTATWFVDPPYGDKGKFYRVGFSDFSALGSWCLRRSGQLIACENEGATWLPFSTMGSFKSSKGMSNEVCFYRDAA